MRIQWNIEKKRGNYRPTLNYVISLEEHERDIAMHAVSVQSTIPRVPNCGRAWCMPDCDERSPTWQAREFHQLQVPYFKTGELSAFLRLPYRDTDEFPEVIDSFDRLRTAYEEVVASVYSQPAFLKREEMTTTKETKEKIAAALTARKMLAFSF